MYNKNLIILYFIFFFIQAINAVVMKKDEVLKIDPKSRNGDTCPEFSLGFTGNYCDYYFICKSDVCNTINTNEISISLIEFPDEKGEMKKYIINGSCQTNSQCLSNICNPKINQCVNDDSISECIINRDTTKIHCGKMALQACHTNNECSSNKCSDSKLCLSEYHDEIMKISKAALIIVIIIITLIILCCCTFCWCCCKKRNNK
ncbi:hypothetical protein LY90DRAFT_671933 [Neocallimastix californiae]|jgi:hypothetical protein|uniref:Dickkopf N-terminal cysteine-rich domain-containing protein n=1 Tax=Neocallimastix californiae TaxID=1754190 RepID=A0A1Y2C4Y5_9FUNG|nr:hypothetical protein LY90DRAFT_671933 [Neocallimastix californiae]|eukprot:ORY42102.1 hypothetical protein LY90DRAFT_671933 [Neocallimastix californiae]